MLEGVRDHQNWPKKLPEISQNRLEVAAAVKREKGVKESALDRVVLC